MDREKTVELYEKLVASQSGFEVKGKASSYTSLNGHMFSFVTKEGAVALRLSPEEQEAFMAKHGTGPVIQHGSVMRGYVQLPDAMLKRTSSAAKYFRASVAYIESLKPKATTRKKKA